MSMSMQAMNLNISWHPAWQITLRYYLRINNIISAKVEAVIPTELWEILDCLILKRFGHYCHLSYVPQTTSHLPHDDRITTEFQPVHFYILDVSAIHGTTLCSMHKAMKQICIKMDLSTIVSQHVLFPSFGRGENGSTDKVQRSYPQCKAPSMRRTRLVLNKHDAVQYSVWCSSVAVPV